MPLLAGTSVRVPREFLVGPGVKPRHWAARSSIPPALNNESSISCQFIILENQLQTHPHIHLYTDTHGPTHAHRIFMLVLIGSGFYIKALC